MWKNKSGWKGSFTNQRQRGQFGREDQQHGKDNRRGNTKWAGHEYSRQNDRSYFQESSKNFRLDQDRYGESAVHVAVEIEGVLSTEKVMKTFLSMLLVYKRSLITHIERILMTEEMLSQVLNITMALEIEVVTTTGMTDKH